VKVPKWLLPVVGMVLFALMAGALRLYVQVQMLEARINFFHGGR